MTTAQLHDFTGAGLELSGFDDARQRWESLVDRHPEASLYHRTRWLELLRRAYGFDLLVALMQSRSQTLAGCVLARSQTPFARSLIAMPFSDRCEPLASDSRTQALLLTMLAADPRVRACEIRGITGPAPWRAVSFFQTWELDVSVPASQLHHRLATNFRRNLTRARRLPVRIERGRGLSLLSRFYLMHSESRRRQGVPVQPASFFCLVRNLFAPSGDFDVWIASHGNVDLAAAVTLRDRGRVYYKWSARSATDTAGAGHFLVWSIVDDIATNAQFFDLGRADVRNHGLSRFKRELGAAPTPLPYSFVPRVPRRTSPEVLSGWHSLAANVWRRMPPRMCQVIGNSIYRYLS